MTGSRVLVAVGAALLCGGGLAGCGSDAKPPVQTNDAVRPGAAASSEKSPRQSESDSVDDWDVDILADGSVRVDQHEMAQDEFVEFVRTHQNELQRWMETDESDVKIPIVIICDPGPNYEALVAVTSAFRQSGFHDFALRVDDRDFSFDTDKRLMAEGGPPPLHVKLRADANGDLDHIEIGPRTLGSNDWSTLSAVLAEPVMMIREPEKPVIEITCDKGMKVSHLFDVYRKVSGPAAVILRECFCPVPIGVSKFPADDGTPGEGR